MLINISSPAAPAVAAAVAPAPAAPAVAASFVSALTSALASASAAAFSPFSAVLVTLLISQTLLALHLLHSPFLFFLSPYPLTFPGLRAPSSLPAYLSL